MGRQQPEKRLSGFRPRPSRKSSWPAALLAAASILSSCFLPTEGQVPNTPIQVLLQPPHPREGQDITLTPRDTGDKAILCRWYRRLITDANNKIILISYAQADSQTNGAAFTGRETAGPKCSLHIRNVTSNDTGNYTVNVDGPGISALGSASVVVSGPDFSGFVKLSVNAVFVITIGSLAVTAFIVGTLLYFFLRARSRRDKASTQTTAAPSSYENVSPSRQVKTDSSAASNIYQTLQHADQSVYQQLKGSRPVSRPAPLS